MIQVKVFYNKHWNIITENNNNGSKPDWKKMEHYPEEAIEKFKKDLRKDGTIYLSDYFIENAEDRINDWLENNKITSKYFISIQHSVTEDSGEFFTLVYSKYE